MTFTIRFTIDTSARGRVALDAIHRHAADASTTFDGAWTTCHPAQAKRFKGPSSARTWLQRRKMISTEDALAKALRGNTPPGPFTDWEICIAI